MMKLLFHIAVTGCYFLIVSAGQLMGQEVRFSQYNAAPVQLNPASPGTVANTTLGLNYRIQQLGILAYKTGYFSAMLPIYSGRDTYDELPIGGLGLGVLSDLAGEQNELQTYQIDFSGAYNIRLNLPQTHYITLGVQASYLQTNVNYGPLTWPSQMTYRGFENPAPPASVYAPKVEAFRFNAGLLWTFDPMRNAWKQLARYRLHLGVAVANLNRPDYSFFQDKSQRLPWIYRVHGGGQFQVNFRLSVSPGFFIIAQETLIQYAGGAVLGIHLPPDTPAEPSDFRLLVGSWYRYGDAVVLLVGASSSRFDTALSYDMNASSQRAGIANQHTLELSVAYRFLNKRTPKVHPTPLF